MAATYTEIAREAMPPKSFVYGQLASFDGVAAPKNSWLVCTDCTHFEDGPVSTAEFWTVLVAHFIYSCEDDARYCAAKLAQGGNVGPVTLVRPANA